MTKFSEYVWRSVPELALQKFAALRPQVEAVWRKEADIIPKLLALAQILPSKPGEGIPNRASPLLGMLVGGMAGAGLGYGAGWVGSQVLPDDWDKHKLRRNLAMVGGGLGAAMPAAMGAWNVGHGRSFNDMDAYRRGYQFPRQPAASPPAALPEAAPVPEPPKPEFGKVGFDGSTTGLYGSFDPDAFNQTLWNDPRVGNRLPMPLLAAASGLVTGAANLPGKPNTSFVTPFDVARMAAGMGTGYLSGLVVGKALNSLLGMPDDTQETLKNTGMYAGLLQTLIPIAFGG